MKVFLAEISNERGQYECLISERFTNGLMSFAYRKHAIDGWETVWNKLMNIYLAGLPSQNEKIQSETLPQIESHLTTYADLKEVEVKEKIFDINILPRVIIDSGAFTAFTTGKVIDPKDYLEWSLSFKKRWQHKMASLEFMNLDVIGDPEGSEKNLIFLESNGLKVIPVITYGSSKEYINRYIQKYDRLAFGGLVGFPKSKSRPWLDFCFSQVMNHYKKTGNLCRIHLLGQTSWWALERYPCYSSDSSSWVSCLRFGQGSTAGIKQIPRYKESDGAMAATIHTLRAEIRKFKKMQDDATKLWEKRGIIFED